MEEIREIGLETAYDVQGLRAIYTACADLLEASAADRGLAGPEDFSPGQWRNRMEMLHSQLFAWNRSILRTGPQIDREKAVSIYRYIYKKLCLEYNQIIYLTDFSEMIGISKSNICNWDTVQYMDIDTIYSGIYKNKENSGIDIDIDIDTYKAIGKSNPGGVKLSEEIQADSEACLVGRMITDKGNPLRYLSILNFRHGWNKETSVSQGEKTLSLAEMRQTLGLLSASDGQPAQKSNRKKDNRQNKGNVLGK